MALPAASCRLPRTAPSVLYPARTSLDSSETARAFATTRAAPDDRAVPALIHALGVFELFVVHVLNMQDTSDTRTPCSTK